LKINNVIIYHAGDTDLIPEMQKLTGYLQPGKEFVHSSYRRKIYNECGRSSRSCKINKAYNSNSYALWSV